MEQKKTAKFNVVDIVILLLVLVAGVFFVMQYANKGPAIGNRQETYPFAGVFESWELPDDRIEGGKIAAGDPVYDKTTGVKVGTVSDIVTKPTRTVVTTADGRFVETTRPYHVHLIVTVKGEGYRAKDGGLMVNGLQMMVNKDFEVHIRDSAFNLRFTSLTINEGS